MKGDFSRVRFNRAKHYTSVLQQQGRVALDADANEQCAIDEDLRASENIDVIGPFGGPEGDAGFVVTVSPNNTIQIGAGRYYVQGLLCENAAPFGYTQQPFLLNPQLSDAQLLNNLIAAVSGAAGATASIQVFLEVWQRLVTCLDDPCLLEPALGRADTTARLQTVWRAVAQLVTPAANTPVTDCCTSMYQPPAPPPSGALNAQTSGGAAADCSCDPTSAAGYRGLENQLYRVEIHQSGTETTATFKWSRENASVVVGITSVTGSQLQVDSLGPDANLGFTSGNWVELSDDTYLFGTPPNMPGQLTQIQSIAPSQLSLTVAPPVGGVNPAYNARMRRWDQSGSLAGPNGIPVSTGWINLENGIQVQFFAGNYVAGDYWIIPARTASGQIDWPPCGGDGSAFQPPHQTEVFRAPLACVHVNATQQFTVEDCRRTFPPLNGVAGASSALHVTQISWNNDDIVMADQFIQNGLTVSLDQAATGTVDSSIFSLTLEVPSNPGATNYGPLVIPRTCTPIDGQIVIQGADITWNFPNNPSGANSSPLLVWLDTLLSTAPEAYALARARVRIRGRDVYAITGSSAIFLDGQTFGKPAIRANGLTPRTDLAFPSGASMKASDFESWFFLVPSLTLVLTVNPSVVTYTIVNALVVPPPVLPMVYVAVSYPVMNDTVVALSISPVTAFATIPASVTILKGTVEATFQVAITNTPDGGTENFQIAGSITNALGVTTAAQGTLTIVGAFVLQ